MTGIISSLVFTH